MKRIFDFLVALFGLLILFPFLLIVAIIIKSYDCGPVFFFQKRVGHYGKPFILIKFRSMSVLEQAKDGIFEPGNTNRITKIGKFLRKTKIDELPQLINVLKGNMSLVGPRPEVERWVKEYPERWKRVLTIKPGITDCASIQFRNENSILEESKDPEKTYREEVLPKKLDLYENYLDNHSFLIDIKLIVKTILSVILK